MTDRPEQPDAARLEELWAGEFGNEYRQRNRDVGAGRGTFWNTLLTAHPADAVLEVGCNNGANLQWIVAHSSQVVGVDISADALRELHERVPDVRTVVAPARELPFPDDSFDLAFTAGVLIHQPTSTLPAVIGEVVRVSRRYVLAMEYRADEEEEVPYRGQEGALFKRDYGALYRSLFPELVLVDTGFLGAESGWDNVTWWLFDKSAAATSAEQPD
jgi:pseudaminic acid biosynthesis-associated methylase